jgi:hypothetical protein
VQVFIPTAPLTSFGNAMALAAMQKLTYSPVGFLAKSGLFKGSPTAETALDRQVMMSKATFGTALGGALAAAAAVGLIKVILRWPDDPEEKKKMEAANLKPGVVLFPLPGGGYFSVSLTAGPLALVSPEIVAGAAIYEVNAKKGKAQAKMNAEAAKTGTTPSKVPGWGSKDVMHVAGVVAMDLLAGTRTASGKASAFSDYGEIVSSKALSGWVSSKIPFLPLFQNTMKIAGVDIDSRMPGAFFDSIVPLPTSGSRRVNVLGDHVGEGRNFTDIISMFTRGTGQFVSAQELAGTGAYANLITSGYNVPAIQQSKTYSINGEFRPLSTGELQRYTVARGQNFKRELETLGSLDGMEPADARKAVQAAFQRANASALSEAGVTVTPRAETAASGRAARGTVPSGGVGGTLGRTTESRSGTVGGAVRRSSGPGRLSRGLRGVRFGRRGLSRASRIRMQPSLGRRGRRLRGLSRVRRIR